MNDGMGAYVANEVIKLMLKKGIQVLNSNILILGFTFRHIGYSPVAFLFSLIGRLDRSADP